MTVATALVLIVVMAVVLGVALRRSDLRDAPAALRLLALACAVVTAAALFRSVWADSGVFALWALGLPVLMTLAPVVAARFRSGPAVTGLAAGFLLLWSVLLGLGVGLFLLPAALAETAAAIAQRRPRPLDRDLDGATPGG